MTLDVVWDEEAMERAVQQARDVTHRDPEAATLLIAQVINQQQRLKELGQQPIVAAYRPAKLYAQMCRFYKGWTPKVIDDMHYLTFFAMVREANELAREENKQMNDIKS